MPLAPLNWKPETDGIVSNLLTALKECIRTRNIERGRATHSQVITIGISSNSYIVNNLINMYSKCGNMREAKHVFFTTGTCRDVVAWTCLIQGYVDNAQPELALQVFDDMAGECAPNARTFFAALAACALLAASSDNKFKWLERGRSLHSQVITQRCSNFFLENLLVDMYGKCGSMDDSKRVFDRMIRRNVESWNALLQGYAANGDSELVLQMFFSAMDCSRNVKTFIIALATCSRLILRDGCNSRWIYEGEAIQFLVERSEFWSDLYLQSVLVDMYGKSKRMARARFLFDCIPQQNVVTWTSLIQGYIENEEYEVALEAFAEMQEAGCLPNARTFVAVLTACAGLARRTKNRNSELINSFGKTVHSRVIRNDMFDVFVNTALINFYSSCGKMSNAWIVFDRVLEYSNTNVACMLQGCGENREEELAWELVVEMFARGVHRDSRALPLFLAALASCGDSVEKGKAIQAQISSSECSEDTTLANALVDFYGRCGNTILAKQVFDSIRKKNVVSWNTLMGAYTRKGENFLVFELFDRMKEQGIHPDKFTFTSILAACSHAGLTHKAREYFESMQEHGIVPDNLHFTCLLDLLGRAGYLDEALQILERMPNEADATMWQTLLGACRKWKNIEIGRFASKRLLEINGKDAMALAMMANIYGV